MMRTQVVSNVAVAILFLLFLFSFIASVPAFEIRKKVILSPSLETPSPRRLTMSPSKSESSNGNNTPFRLDYVTDVEGNIDYFLRFISRSQVLCVREYTHQALVLDFQDPSDTNCYFVYGGDAVDKGPGDIRLVRALVDLKQRYPQQVYLLVGNRDLNKLRFAAELSDQDLARPCEKIPPPHWDPAAPSLKEFLQQKLLEEKNEDASTRTTLEDLDTRLNRLQYMLQHTLGCPQTFEFRRQELATLRRDHNMKDDPATNNAMMISDHEVLESFLYEVQDPQGSLRQYLECANVAVIIGNTLFCHGAVDDRTMKFVPRDDTKFENPTSKPPPAAMIDNVHDWVQALNQYLKQGLHDFQRRPLFNADRTSRGGEALMALQNRPAMWGRSIVSNCYGDGGCIHTPYAVQQRLDPERVALEETQPLVFEKVCSDPLDQSVADWLQKDGIQRVVVGHKPTGDCPAVLSALYTGVEIVSADTSFSDTSADDNRGQAFTAVGITGASTVDNQLVLRGVLRNGQDYQSHFVRLHPEGIDTSTGDVNLGRQLKHEDFWVKVATCHDRYWLSRGKNRHVEYKEVHKTEVSSWHLQEVTTSALH